MKRHFCYIISCLITGSSALHAQDTRIDSLHALQDKRIFDQYRLTNNAAAIANAYQPEFGYATAKVGFVSGDFKRPMESSSSTIYTLSTGGITKIGQWRFLADFNYRKIYDNRIAWAAVNDPYDGNPFIWVDSSTGNWDRDHIDATIGIATTINRKLQVGLVINYAIGTGARTSEPKPFYRIRDISLKPGIIWNISATEAIGLAGEAGFVQEENEIGFYSNSNVLLYRLRGYGTFSKSPFVSGERKRKGTDWQGLLSYQRRWGKYDFHINATASQRDEEVLEGVATTQATGYFTGINFGGRVHLFKGTPLKGKSLDLIYENKSGYADDMIFRAESASFIKHSLKGNVSFWKQLKKESGLIQWSICPTLDFVDFTDQAAYMQFTATIIGGTIGLNWRKRLTRKIKLNIQPRAGYFNAADAHFTARSHQVIIQQLIIPDYAWFSSDYWKAGCLLQVQVQPERIRYTHFITLLTDASIVNKNKAANRTLFQLQYSILF